MSDQKYLAIEEPAWHHPDDSPPPKGTKLQLLTPGGIAVYGQWESWAVAWAPLLKVPQALKIRIRQEQKFNQTKDGQ